MRLSSRLQGSQHQTTIPAPKSLRVGTLHSMLGEVAEFLQIPVQELHKELFDSA